jgi:transcriptional regulator with XRE-family HTH domain
VVRERTTEPVGPEAKLFGARLRELRQKRSLRLEDLAEKAHMSLTFLSNLEGGLKIPSLTTLVRLAVALDCKLTALVAPFDKADLRAMLPK